jgi:hypothetical protein
MKKILIPALVISALFVSPSFATSQPISIMPVDMIEIEKTTIDSSEIIIRNNILESDYKYNSTHYYTTKMNAKDIVIPKDIKEKAEKIYFLVEEGQSRIYYGKGMMLQDEASVEDVKKEYNYKTVAFKKGQTEYLFDNSDLVKEFGKDEYNNVQITLMAEMEDGKKMPVSNTAYVSMNDKKSVLNQLKRNDADKGFYFGYYNSDDLETYLEKMALKMTISEYNTMLKKADKKIKSSLEKNEKNMKTILASISKESDFKKYITDYKVYTETSSLL